MCASFSLKTGKVSLSIGVRITMIRCVVYLLVIFKMFHGLMNNPVYSVRYYPWFQVTAVGLGMYYPWIWGYYCIHKHIYTYIYIYVCVCVYFCNLGHTITKIRQ
jgi:hypothetical protein